MVNEPDHVRRNRAAWDSLAGSYAGPGLSAWSDDEPRWGVFSVPDARVGLLPADPAGLEVTDLIELQAPAGAVSPDESQSAEWAHQWPCEEVWKARKPG